MRVVLHVGPHKTGTTSIQNFLLTHFSVARDGLPWYPTPQEWGPGHAALAWETLNISEYSNSTNDDRLKTIKSILESARKTNVSMVIFSSEEFSKIYKKNFNVFHNVIDGCSLELIFTLNSVLRRVRSEWQELVKHKHTYGIAESRKTIFNRPGMQPNLVNILVKLLEPNRTCILFSKNNDDPKVLIQAFCTAANIDISKLEHSFNNKHNICLNPSVHRLETEILLLLNRNFDKLHDIFPTLDYIAIRTQFMAMFLGENWKKNMPRQEIQIPCEWNHDIKSLAFDTISSIEEIVASRKVQLYGNSGVLLEGLN